MAMALRSSRMARWGPSSSAMMSSMGGASGVVFGTLFRGGGKAVREMNAFDAAALAAFLQSAADGIAQRGGANVLYKTIATVILPIPQGDGASALACLYPAASH